MADEKKTFFATIAKNLEPLLADELETLGMSEVTPSASGAYFEGTIEDAYRVILWSRLANSVLMPLGESFDAKDDKELYRGVRRIRWRDHMDVTQTLAVDFTSAGSNLDHTHYGALRVKDAIVDQFRDEVGSRPSVDTNRPDLRVNVHVRRDEATVSIDLSGVKLHRRGWRVRDVTAPLKENLAAAILWRAGWPEMAAQGKPLLDPMCGSGSFPIEAWMMAADIAPGLERTERMGFECWKQHDPEIWRGLVEEALERRAAGLERDLPTIVGYDKDRDAIDAARQNLGELDGASHVRILPREIREIHPVGDEPGLLVVNPPYGERLEDVPEAMQIHEWLGEVMVDRFVGWRASVLTGSKELGFAIPIRARKVYSVYNGPLQCVLLHFDITPERFFLPDED